MSRKLNPELFGPVETSIVNVELGAQFQQKKFREIEMQIEAVNQKIDKWVKILDNKIQQTNNVQKSLSEQIKNVTEHFAKQQAGIQSRLNERRTSEAKTQELIDRHNQLVHSFETRVSHIQKVATEQEMKLLAYKATYDEILREIRNLKD